MALPSKPGRSARESLDSRKSMDDLGHGVKATIIDFGLSRMNVKDPKTGLSSTQFTVLDDTIFNGEG